jgi:hypothetical protein
MNLTKLGMMSAIFAILFSTVAMAGYSVNSNTSAHVNTTTQQPNPIVSANTQVSVGTQSNSNSSILVKISNDISGGFSSIGSAISHIWISIKASLHL